MYMVSSWMEPDGTKPGKDTLSVEFKHKLAHLKIIKSIGTSFKFQCVKLTEHFYHMF